jgi:hypothetical protein
VGTFIQADGLTFFAERSPSARALRGKGVAFSAAVAAEASETMIGDEAAGALQWHCWLWIATTDAPVMLQYGLPPAVAARSHEAEPPYLRLQSE